MITSQPPQSKPPIRVELEPARRLLRIHFQGNVAAADMRIAVEQLHVTLAELGPGFMLLTDLSDLEEMSIDSVRDLTRFMDLCLKAGVKQIVRVIPDPSKDIGFHLLSMTHYRGRVPIAMCETLAEAERVLHAERPRAASAPRGA